MLDTILLVGILVGVFICVKELDWINDNLNTLNEITINKKTVPIPPNFDPK